MVDDFQVGNDAGWHLVFGSAGTAPLTIGSGDYHADITATLPGGLDGGLYRVVIEGITDDHFRRLHAAMQAPAGLQADLHLYWRDTAGVPTRLLDLAGLADAVDAIGGPPPDSRVARLSVTRVSRRVGARRYEAVIEARESVFHRLARPLAAQPDAGSDLLDAAMKIAALLDVPARSHPWPGGSAPAATAPLPPPAGTSGVTALLRLADAMTQRHGRAGRGLLLIRDGTLHIGPGRGMPLDREAPLLLGDASGLVHVETSGQSQPASGGAVPELPLPRTQYGAVLKGRPDIRPGEVVLLNKPVDDDVTTPGSLVDALAGLGNSLLGATAPQGAQARVYVSSVSHRLSRTEGFSTTLAGVEVVAGDEWDAVDGSAAQRKSSPDPEASAEAQLASALQQRAAPTAASLHVGEVRAATTQGQAEPPAQTVDLWLGLEAGDGQPMRARRLPVRRDAPSRAGGVPYLTPFAWGPCGLVLPRYPGTRVVVGLADGASDDPVELGALWESGHAPASQAGDWWLILPAAVAEDARAALPDTATPAEPTGHASNDLTDADGARVIEVGRLTVRVQPGSLAPPGTRPQPPADDAEHVTIEHESGSRIVIRSNGDITIEAKGDLNFKVDKALKIQADEVLVKVNKTMDVS
jgi:hypothetical protein